MTNSFGVTDNQVLTINVNPRPEKPIIVGDVDFQSAQEQASWITPVPGGVGPVTVTMLMRNAIEAFKQQHNSTNTSLT